MRHDSLSPVVVTIVFYFCPCSLQFNHLILLLASIPLPIAAKYYLYLSTKSAYATIELRKKSIMSSHYYKLMYLFLFSDENSGDLMSSIKLISFISYIHFIFDYIFYNVLLGTPVKSIEELVALSKREIDIHGYVSIIL